MADSEECYKRRRKERNKEKERNEDKKKNKIKKAAKGPLHDARTRDEEKRQVSCDRIRCHVGKRVAPISMQRRFFRQLVVNVFPYPQQYFYVKFKIIVTKSSVCLL